LSNNNKSAHGDSDYRLPLFVVPGMPRAGTTFLYHNLQKHPQIFLPFRKEIDFFNEIYRHRGIEWFHSLYREIKPGQIAGDLSPACWFEPNAIGYIKDYDANVKVILSLRDPAENAYSLYIQKLTSNYDLPKSFDEFLIKGYSSIMTKHGKGVHFVFTSRDYIEKIEAYKKAFGKNLLIYDFRFFRRNNLGALRIIEDFLGLYHWFNENNFDALRINESYRRNIKIIYFLLTQEWLRDLVEKYVPRLTAMRIRGYIDRISVRTSVKDNTRQTHQAEYIDIARKHFSEACSYYEELFGATPAFLGDGSSVNIR
jgi:Sulfotransferase domain